MTTYIYLVRSGGLLSPGAVPVAGFTSKRKMTEWLRGKSDDTLSLMTVWRMEDGGAGAVVELSVTEFLTDEEGT